ncbi:MAG: methyltransferase, partial [Desulfobacterales bacterium]|nr:methyltransferase [Desulfobacterales bacterium]
CAGRDPENSDCGFIGNWEEDGFSFLFFSRQARDAVERIVRERPGLTLLDTFQMSYDEWQGGALTPFEAGGFLIHPPWSPPPGERGQAGPGKEETERIVLDPGVVFGAGAHLTTRDCLGAVRMACRGRRVETVLDLGAGTGILAIAAAKLGCKKVLAADLNLLAARTARRNIRLNNLENRVLAVRARAEDLIHIPGDLVVANIHYDVMKNLIESEGFLAKKWFILSGLMRSEAKAVEETLARKSTVILEKWIGDGIWCTYFGRNG